MKKSRKLSSDTKGTLQTIEAALEVLVFSLVYYMFWRIGYEYENFPEYMGKGKYVLVGLYALLSWLFIQNSDGFQFGSLRKSDLAFAHWIGMLIVNFITYLQLSLIANRMISAWPILLLMASDVILSVIFILAYSGLYERLYAPHNMILIYGSDNAVVMKIKMDTRKDKYRVNRLIAADEGFERIRDEIDNYESVILNDVPAELRNDILKYCYDHKIRTYVVPKITDIIIRGGESLSAFDTPMLLVKGTGLTVGQRFLKRTLDIVLCLIAMIPAAPIMLLVALAIKIEDGGPAFYRQKRMTQDGREFDILKFRSMIVDAEKYSGAILAADNDPRITKVGKFIRATRLDEIPQILNILKGDMSIVGPRPERKKFVDEFCEKIPEFRYRMKVKGGLTGYAQIYGKYNTSPYDKLRLDLMYIENYSLMLDIKLILMTVRIMLKKDSTEGIDKAEAMEAQKQALLEKVQQENTAETHEKEPVFTGQ